MDVEISSVDEVLADEHPDSVKVVVSVWLEVEGESTAGDVIFFRDGDEPFTWLETKTEHASFNLGHVVLTKRAMEHMQDEYGAVRHDYFDIGRLDEH
jgi:hypothetical protein